ncbi:TPA: four helix bundle protein [Photobacterium damselae]|uniref:four helix bundle protein n=1 Tax=Photobacterium damselae TaxID=38293 RepID=UPI002090372D|nr:four helix bundle protein [Photobacterium damselae]USR76595.1 four helix bundle protein [Photobacterium damselae]
MRCKDLEIWKRSYQLSVSVNMLMKDCRDFGLKDQICRASVSIPSNISEGAERGSNRDFIRFLYFSKGSCAELYTQLMMVRDFEYADECIVLPLLEEAARVNKMIGSYIHYLKKVEQR